MCMCIPTNIDQKFKTQEQKWAKRGRNVIGVDHIRKKKFDGKDKTTSEMKNYQCLSKEKKIQVKY